jgi:hypothetical protein
VSKSLQGGYCPLRRVGEDFIPTSMRQPAE